MFRTIIPLLFAAAILLGANGVFGTLIALRATIEGFDANWVGIMGAAYFIGFAIASFNAARLIRLIGHVRTFAALAAIGAVVPLVLSIFIDPWVWTVMRGIGGFCFAAILMVVESWINEVTKNTNRGRVLGIYRIIDLLAVTGCQFLIPVVGEGGHEIFEIISLMYCLSLVPVAVSMHTHPKAPDNLKLELGAIWKISPLACLTSFAIGLTNSAFRLIGPLYGIQIGLDTSAVVLFMSLGIIGGTVLQYPLGYMSDKLGRRKTVLCATLGAMFAATILSLQQTDSVFVYIGVFGFGAFALPLYSLAAAHANDRAGIGQYVLVAAGLSFFFSVGAVIGPYTASLVIKHFGPSAFFLYTCLVHGTLAFIVMIRINRHASVPKRQRSNFVMLKTLPIFSHLERRISQIKRK